MTLSASKDNGLADDASFIVAGSKPGARCRLSAQLKPKSKSLDSTDKEEEQEESRYAKGDDEGDDVFTKGNDEGKRTGVK